MNPTRSSRGDPIHSMWPEDDRTQEPLEQQEDPTVLEYLRNVLKTGRFSSESKPESAAPAENSIETRETARQSGSTASVLLVLAVVSALIAQISLEPPQQRPVLAAIFYGICLVLILVYMRRNAAVETGEVQTSASAESDAPWIIPDKNVVLPAVLVTLLAFIRFSGNRFNLFNVILWLAAIALTIRVFMLGLTPRSALRWVRAQTEKQLRLPWRSLLITLLVMAIVLFFRVTQLDRVPGEMWSDQGEKLLDVMDILRGQLSIFFVRNTGREGFQMYLTAFIAKYLGTGISFLSLKIGTVFAGLFGTFYLYLLARELIGKKGAVVSVLLMGVAYWPNIISRVGLRYSLYIMFTAPVMYHLLVGLRKRSVKHLIVCGIFLGIGLHGYSTFRIVPLLVALGIWFYWIAHRQSMTAHQALSALGLIAAVAFVLFLPLARYLVDNPEMFSYRALTRLGTVEQTYPGNVLVIFLSNLWNSLIMPFWQDGKIWVHSIPDRPALDFVSGAFYFIGLVIMVLRAFQQRDWRFAWILISIPFLMLPSILSLAFPEENPALNRSAAAALPIFVVAGYGAVTIWTELMSRVRSASYKVMLAGLASLLFIITLSSNYNLVFKQYRAQFDELAWNSSEMGAVVKAFSESVGSYDHAYVVPYAYWVDTKLVAIEAGHPGYEIAVWPEHIPDTLAQTGSKLFLLKSDDKQGLAQLQSTYASGYFWLYPSKIGGREFMVFFVPAMP